MSRPTRIIDYDKIEEWSPWLVEAIEAIAPHGLIEALRNAKPEYVQDARNQVVAAVGRDRLVEHLNSALEADLVRVFHGTRVTAEELCSIEQRGLQALKLSDRRDALIAVFRNHPDWATSKEELLDKALLQLGPEWMRGGAGKREDGSVHACLSRAGLLYGCNHYLTHGAEVDQHIAQTLFPGESGLALLSRARAAKIVSFTAPFPDAARAANPHGVRPPDLPALIDLLVSAWAYRLANPTFTVVSQTDTSALRFPGPIGPNLIKIEDIDDAELQQDND